VPYYFILLFFFRNRTDLGHCSIPVFFAADFIASFLKMTNSPKKVTPLWKPFFIVDDAQRR